MNDNNNIAPSTKMTKIMKNNVDLSTGLIIIIVKMIEMIQIMI